MILPVPERATLEEIVQFSLLDEEEADLIYLRDLLQDLMVFLHYSEFFHWVLEGLLRILLIILYASKYIIPAFRKVRFFFQL